MDASDRLGRIAAGDAGWGEYVLIQSVFLWSGGLQFSSVVKIIRTPMLSTNPYQTPGANRTDRNHRRVSRRMLCMSLACACFLVAGILFFRSESFTMYTPYSIESNWLLSLPSGEIFINSPLALAILIFSLVLGILFTLLAVVPTFWRKSDAEQSGEHR